MTDEKTAPDTDQDPTEQAERLKVLPDEVVENLEKQAPLPAPIPEPGPM
ncbi:MAG: hypothetical protein V4812_19245 [Pseudomonadota bacterium]